MGDGELSVRIVAEPLRTAERILATLRGPALIAAAKDWVVAQGAALGNVVVTGAGARDALRVLRAALTGEPGVAAFTKLIDGAEASPWINGAGPELLVYLARSGGAGAPERWAKLAAAWLAGISKEPKALNRVIGALWDLAAVTQDVLPLLQYAVAQLPADSQLHRACTTALLSFAFQRWQHGRTPAEQALLATLTVDDVLCHEADFLSALMAVRRARPGDALPPRVDEAIRMGLEAEPMDHLWAPAFRLAAAAQNTRGAAVERLVQLLGTSGLPADQFLRGVHTGTFEGPGWGRGAAPKLLAPLILAVLDSPVLRAPATARTHIARVLRDLLAEDFALFQVEQHAEARESSIELPTAAWERLRVCMGEALSQIILNQNASMVDRMGAIRAAVEIDDPMLQRQLASLRNVPELTGLAGEASWVLGRRRQDGMRPEAEAAAQLAFDVYAGRHAPPVQRQG